MSQLNTTSPQTAGYGNKTFYHRHDNLPFTIFKPDTSESSVRLFTDSATERSTFYLPCHLSCHVLYQSAFIARKESFVTLYVSASMTEEGENVSGARALNGVKCKLWLTYLL
jgi:hypothetical protein